MITTHRVEANGLKNEANGLKNTGQRHQMKGGTRLPRIRVYGCRYEMHVYMFYMRINGRARTVSPLPMWK